MKTWTKARTKKNCSKTTTKIFSNRPRVKAVTASSEEDERRGGGTHSCQESHLCRPIDHSVQNKPQSKLLPKGFFFYPIVQTVKKSNVTGPTAILGILTIVLQQNIVLGNAVLDHQSPERYGHDYGILDKIMYFWSRGPNVRRTLVPGSAKTPPTFKACNVVTESEVVVKVTQEVPNFFQKVRLYHRLPIMDIRDAFLAASPRPSSTRPSNAFTTRYSRAKTCWCTV